MQGHLMLAVVASFLGAPVPQKDATEDKKAIEGMWVVESAHREGKADDAIKGDKLTFKAGNITIQSAKGEKDEKGTYVLDPGKKPATIDMTAADDKKEVVKGIYALEGDTLKICMTDGPDKESRPTEFSAKKGSRYLLVVLKRLKK